MIRLACPGCAKHLSIDDVRAGMIGKCPACAHKFRIPAAPAAADEPADALELFDDQPPHPPKSRPTRPAAPQLDDLEIIDDESPAGAITHEPIQRRRAVPADKEILDVEAADEDDEAPARPSAPRWVVVTSIVAGVLLLGLLPVAFFYKAAAYALIGIGLPGSLLSRKWYLLGTTGAGYLLAGVSFFLLHVYFDRVRPHGPPAAGSSARECDEHCSALLQDSRKVEGRAWASNQGQNNTARAQRALVEAAYKAGVREVWATNVGQVDPDGNSMPDFVLVLPDDGAARKRVFAWRKGNSRRPEADVDQKYLYMDLD